MQENREVENELNEKKTKEKVGKNGRLEKRAKKKVREK